MGAASKNRSAADDGHSIEGIDFKRIAQVSAIAAVLVTLVSRPEAAHAEERAWKPRRHYRRMGERISDKWADEAVEAEARQVEEAMSRSQRQKLLKQQQEEEDFQRMRKEQEQRMKNAEKILTQSEPSGRQLPFSIKVGNVELFPYLFWGTILALILWASRSALQQGRRKQGGGKWVYDRSLGGKKVWVPDGTDTPAGASSRNDEFDRLVSVAASASVRTKQNQARKEFAIPSWWNLAPTSFASPDVKAAKQVEADRLLTQIEQAKNRGEDYSMRDILELRSICQEGGVSVRPKTVGARDAIYQTAVDCAVLFGQDRTNSGLSLGEQDSEFPETRLLTALAGDLNMPDERAVGMVKVAVTAACRARLLDAVRNLKGNNEMDALVALMHLSTLLQHLPAIEPGQPEPELIASSLQATSSLDERQKIFYILGQLNIEKASLFAEMLGFDPTLVVPKLFADVDEYLKQQQAQPSSQSA